MDKLDEIQERISPPQEEKTPEVNPHDVFSLEDLIRKLEDIRDGRGDAVNMAKVVYTLACEVRAIKIALCTHENMNAILDQILIQEKM